MARGRWSTALLRLAEWAALAGLGGWFALWLQEPGHAPGTIEGNDVRVFYDGAALFRQTGNPYGQGFVSPPWFALLLLPLTLLPFEQAAWLWLGLSLASSAGAAWLALRLAGIPPTVVRALAAALALAWWPAGQAGLLLGQNSALVLLLVAGALVALGDDRPVLAGALFGLAFVKPQLTVLLFLGAALRAGQTGRARPFWLGTGGMVAALLVLTLAARRAWLPALLAGLPESWNYWGSTVTVNTWLASWLGAAEPLRSALLVPPLLAGAAFTVWAWSRSAASVAWSGAATLAATFLATPYAYPHDYVLLLIPALVVARGLWKRHGVGAAPALLALGGLAWALPLPFVYEDPVRFQLLGLPLALTLGLLVVGRPGSRPAPRALES